MKRGHSSNTHYCEKSLGWLIFKCGNRWYHVLFSQVFLFCFSDFGLFFKDEIQVSVQITQSSFYHFCYDNIIYYIWGQIQCGQKLHGRGGPKTLKWSHELFERPSRQMFLFNLNEALLLKILLCRKNSIFMFPVYSR